MGAAVLGLSLLVSHVGLAQEPAPLDPGIRIEAEAPDAEGPARVEGEIIPEPDMEPFLKAGFEEMKWLSYGKERDNVERNLLGPDYKERTGNDLPDFVNFDYALMNVTGGKYNDVIVWSMLPGDCDQTGCLLSVFHLGDDDKWKVVARFHATVVMHRYAKGPDPDKPVSEFASPAYEAIPAAVYRWNGKEFAEQ